MTKDDLRRTGSTVSVYLHRLDLRPIWISTERNLHSSSFIGKSEMSV